ncbi:MAG TPA: cell division protein FtsH, partial [Synergistales bacterium]|nr:cell division protein FtsH [Synergistales bacterium]
VKLGHKHNEVFLGRDIGEERNYSDAIAYAIDQEVKAIIDSCYEKVRNILVENSEEMEKIAKTLLEKEIIEGKELNALLGLENPEEEKVVGPEEEERTETQETIAEENPVGESKNSDAATNAAI